MAMKDAEAAAMVEEVMVAAKAAMVAVGWEKVGMVAVAQVAVVRMVVKVVAEAMMVAKGVTVAVVAKMVRENQCEAFPHRPCCC